MKTNPLKEGAFSAGIGVVTPEMVQKRAIEVALINGHSPEEVPDSDFEQAERELTGDPDADPQPTVLESVPESERWAPIYGSTGHKIPEPTNDDEDADGRSDSERHVEEGIAEAERDQMLQTAKLQQVNDEQ